MIATLQTLGWRFVGAAFFDFRSWHLFFIRHPYDAARGRGVLAAHAGPVYMEFCWGRA